jgi:hypothetical protein
VVSQRFFVICIVVVKDIVQKELLVWRGFRIIVRGILVRCGIAGGTKLWVEDFVVLMIHFQRRMIVFEGEGDGNEQWRSWKLKLERALVARLY